MRYVSDDAHRRAREIEARFAALPTQAGVLFVSVKPEPAEDGNTEKFIIRLGITRRFDEETGSALAKRVLEEDLKAGTKIYVSVYRGISCACRDDGTPSARSLAS